MRRLVTVIAALLSQQCATPLQDYSIDASVAPSDAKIVREAGARINAWTGRDVVVITTSGDTRIIRNGNLAEWHLGSTSGDHDVITIDIAQVHLSSEPKRYDPLLYNVVTHELLHSLGMEHTSVGVMATYVTFDVEFSDEDLAQCLRIGLCRR